MIKRNKILILLTSAALSAGVLSGCEKLDEIEPGASGEQDGADETATENDTDDPSDVDAEPVEADDDPVESEPDAEDETPDLDPEPADPGQIDDDQFSVLPTDHCPIDIPAPFTPHAVDSEEAGDGAEIFCIVHVSSKGDPVYLEQDIMEQFKGHNAELLSNVTAADPYDADDISIQTWLYQDYEVIVNQRYVGPTGVELVYVVRDTERRG